MHFGGNKFVDLCLGGYFFSSLVLKYTKIVIITFDLKEWKNFFFAVFSACCDLLVGQEGGKEEGEDDIDDGWRGGLFVLSEEGEFISTSRR